MRLRLRNLPRFAFYNKVWTKERVWGINTEDCIRSTMFFVAVDG